MGSVFVLGLCPVQGLLLNKGFLVLAEVWLL